MSDNSRFYNNCTAETNGEINLYSHLKSKITSFFDVGARDDTYYIDSDSIEYHLFEPNKKFFSTLKNKVVLLKKKVKLNNFGLGLEDNFLPYYNEAQSFLQRTHYLNQGKDLNPTDYFRISRLDKYLEDHSIESVDFMKIDTEGFEFDVLKGAGEKLKIFKLIQFEYGGTYPDRKVKLKDVTDLLTSHGYKIFLICPNDLREVNDFTDHYQYCNYLAVSPSEISLIQGLIFHS